MNFLTLVFKQMRQRALSTTLNILSVLLGIGLVIAITIVTRAGSSLFAQTDFGYDIIIGPPKGSPLQLTLNTVYQIDQSPGVIPYTLYEDMSRRVTLMGTAPLVGGKASFTTGALAPGGHDITAFYSGDAANAASTSASVTEMVNAPVTPPPPAAATNPSETPDSSGFQCLTSPPAAVNVNGKATTIALGSSGTPRAHDKSVTFLSSDGQPVSFTATVSGPATGMVYFLDDKPPPGHADFYPDVRQAVPFMVGDSFKGRRIVGTSPQMFGVDDAGNRVKKPFEYRKDQAYELAAGRVFAPRKFEAVIGCDIANELHLHLYDASKSETENLADGGAFRATHGMPAPGLKPDIHKPRWHIVGILKPTHTASDRVLFIPFVSLYAIAEHQVGMISQILARSGINADRVPSDRLDEVLSRLGVDPKRIPESLRKQFKAEHKAATPTSSQVPQDVGELMKDATVTQTAAPGDEGEDPDVFHLDKNGDIVPDLPPKDWELSAILVRSRGQFQAQRLMYNFKVIDDRATAVNPASVMREFFDTFLSGTTKVFLLISVLVTLVAGASIMTTIYNSVAARRREIAILRALGATRVRILSMICFEAALIGLFGGILGFIGGHLLSGLGSQYLRQTIGEGFNWAAVGGVEFLYLAGVVALSFLAGLVPALKAYRTPVATSLVAS